MMEYESAMFADLIDHMGSDASIVRAARVSTSSDTAKAVEMGKAEEGLIRYLMRNRHGSPFEHATMTFRVQAPLFVMRELMRHRIASYNESSGRYRELPQRYYLPWPDRPAEQQGKAGEYEFVMSESGEKEDLAHECIMEVSEIANSAYERMIQQGVAREVARMVLPLNLYSEAYVTINLRSLMNFLSLRTKSANATFMSYPMLEIDELARNMERHFMSHYPITWKEWNGNGRIAP